MFIQRIVKRVKIALALGADPLSSARFALARPSRQHSPRLAIGRMRGQTFFARGQDFPALTEIVLDDEYGFVRPLLRSHPSPTVVDLGANIGLFAIGILAQHPAASVHSFEPVPSTFAVLIANRRRIGLTGWRCYNLAIADADTFVPIAARPWSTSARVELQGGWEGVALSPSMRLSTLVHTLELAHTDLVKIDIEGMEEDVLIDARTQLKDIANLVVEVHPPISNPETIIKLLVEEFPYVYEVQRGGSTKPLLLASRLDHSSLHVLEEIRPDERK